MSVSMIVGTLIEFWMAYTLAIVMVRSEAASTARVVYIPLCALGVPLWRSVV